MLNQLRSAMRRLTMPSFMKSLKGFSVQGIRNTKYTECTSGEQAWKDMSRNDISINGQNTNINQLIDRYNKENPRPQGNEYRTILHSMLNSTFYRYSGQKINPALRDECITMLNQTSLHGSLYTQIMHSAGKDIQHRIYPNNSIIPAPQCYDTKIKVISNSTLKVQYQETINFRDIASGDTVCTVKGKLSFYVSANEHGHILYNSPKISLQLPAQISSALVPRSRVFMSNMFTPLSNIVGRINAFFTNTPFQKTTPYKITRGNDIARIEYSLQNYACLPVSMETQDQKEENQEKQIQQQAQHDMFEDIPLDTEDQKEENQEQQTQQQAQYDIFEDIPLDTEDQKEENQEEQIQQQAQHNTSQNMQADNTNSKNSKQNVSNKITVSAIVHAPQQNNNTPTSSRSV
ncbi:hypothetical protein [Ehrlichia chaffeensis]|uniref:hypothetical protein n=3 Tax=Ehrlichia chaffeensis TaxID=945 RepID=UPI000053C6A8|nr:hypothetical protein [Ehrlichia chaffeensis]